jgi:hypothetical protein
MTMADMEKLADRLPWGTPAEVSKKIICLAEHTGAGTVQVNFNRGAMPQEMFVEQIRRFARDVLLILQAPQITHVPGADHVSH